MNKTIAFLTFEQWHNKKNIGSSRIRAEWLINYWEEAEIFEQGKKYEVVIFQKVYWKDYVEAYKGIKILDLCVSKDSLIFTDEGWKYANGIKIGDRVLTHKGRFQRVNKVFVRQAKISKIKASGLCDLKITKNHPVWSLNKKYNGYGKVELKEDFNFVPIEKLDIWKRHKGGNCITSIKKRDIEVNNMNENLGWFWGYFSAEGSRNKNGVSFAMHKNEIEHRENIIRIIKEEFNKKGRYYEKYNTGNIVFSSRKLSRYIAENCKSRENKTVVEEIFNASIKTKLKFLEGYIAGDGYCNDYGGICVSTISKKMAFSVLRLLKDCGIIANINYHKREGENYCFRHKNGKVYQGKPQWRIQLNPKEAIKFYNLTDIEKYKKCKIDYWKSLKSTSIQIDEKDRYFLHPVRKKEENKVEETVYNFDVGDDHSYIVDDVVVKNCDPDWYDTVPIKEIADNCHAITTSTETLAEAVRQFTDKPVICIPDRVDLEKYEQKKHKGKAKKVCWFGYSHNTKVLDVVIPTLKKYGLELVVISDFRPPYSKADENVKYPISIKEFNEQILKCDFVIMPEDERPRGRFKSNNKTIISWTMGMPVAKNGKDLIRFLDENERQKEADKRLKEVKEKYDVKLSVLAYKKLIDDIKKEKII